MMLFLASKSCIWLMQSWHNHKGNFRLSHKLQALGRSSPGHLSTPPLSTGQVSSRWLWRKAQGPFTSAPHLIAFAVRHKEAAKNALHFPLQPPSHGEKLKALSLLLRKQQQVQVPEMWGQQGKRGLQENQDEGGGEPQKLHMQGAPPSSMHPRGH